MTDAATQPMLVEQARELFFMQGLDPEERIAPHISRSWQRSRPVARDVVAPAPMALARLDERREQAMRLLQCAQPELDGLAEHAVGNGCVVILTDASGLILDEIGSADFLPKAERIALTPGVEWSEGSRGTNAIGTALAEREALMVLGREHYLPQNGAIGCAAAPIFTGRGEVAGVLDISGETVRVNSHALGLVRMAAQQVEHRMLLADASGHVLRFHRRPGLLGTAREAVLVIDDGHVVAANRVALAMLGLTWDGLLDQRVEPLIGKQWGRVEHQRGLLTLPGGQQIAATMDRFGGASASLRGTARAARIGAGDAPEPDDVRPLLDRAVRVLNEGVPVLVSGETGSGKEVFARRLHAASRRRAGPFVAVNCAALPESLIEAELFGYDEGAFTGARKRGVPGRIREAHGGVLFLDEIADMPLAMQTRLLRVLEERVVTPLGGGPGVAVDFDLVCATHGDLAALAAQQRFRSDLLYRVAGFSVSVPALRERADRVALIERLFMECGGAAKTLQLAETALAQLAAYRWPGNVRELRSVLKSIVALADPGDCIAVEHLPEALRCMPIADERTGCAVAGETIAPGALEDIERHGIDAALAACANNVSAAARQLGVHRSTVYRHLAGRRAGV